AREAHNALAVAMANLIHGEVATTEAQQASNILFGGDLVGINESTFDKIVGEVPTIEIDKSKLEGEGMPILGLFVPHLCQSNGQARKDLQGGGLNLNNERQSDPQLKITTDSLLFGKHLLLRKGKRNYTVVTVK
ncbi:MAG: tyrosine--tRNA ligase, partial [Verrucomicrobiota bacterium]|nr:tyrosine--tRNA ligase [Verrucomicrobiota bacterium]